MKCEKELRENIRLILIVDEKIDVCLRTIQNYEEMKKWKKKK